MSKISTRIFAAITLVVIILLLACTAPTPTPTQPSTPSTPAPPQAAPIVLKFSHFDVPAVPLSIPCEWWCEEIEKRTDGRVKANYYPSGQLGAYADFPEMLDGGVHDIAILPAFRFSSLNIFELPFLIPGGLACIEAAYEAYDKGFLTDIEKYKMMWIQSAGGTYMLFRDKRPNSEAELKGLKIRGQPGPRLEIINALGATGVTMDTKEVYTSLERGIIDGTVSGEPVFYPQKLVEVAPNCCSKPINGGVPTIVMNKNVWNSLPQDIQNIIDKLNVEAKDYYISLMKTRDQEYHDIKAEGFTLYDLSDAENARWDRVGDELTRSYIAKFEAGGLPATQIYEICKAAQARVK